MRIEKELTILQDRLEKTNGIIAKNMKRCTCEDYKREA